MDHGVVYATSHQPVMCLVNCLISCSLFSNTKLNDDVVLLLLAVKKHLITSLRDFAEKRDVIGDSLRDVTVGVVSVAVAICALMLATQLIEAMLLTLVTLLWKRRRDDHHDDISTHHHYQQQQQQQLCSDDWAASTYAQFDDVTETCSPAPQQRNVLMFDLTRFAETNV